MNILTVALFVIRGIKRTMVNKFPRKDHSKKIGVMPPKSHLRARHLIAQNKQEKSKIASHVDYVGPPQKQFDFKPTRIIIIK